MFNKEFKQGFELAICVEIRDEFLKLKNMLEDVVKKNDASGYFTIKTYSRSENIKHPKKFTLYTISNPDESNDYCVPQSSVPEDEFYSDPISEKYVIGEGQSQNKKLNNMKEMKFDTSTTLQQLASAKKLLTMVRVFLIEEGRSYENGKITAHKDKYCTHLKHRQGITINFFLTQGTIPVEDLKKLNTEKIKLQELMKFVDKKFPSQVPKDKKRLKELDLYIKTVNTRNTLVNKLSKQKAQKLRQEITSDELFVKKVNAQMTTVLLVMRCLQQVGIPLDVIKNDIIPFAFFIKKKENGKNLPSKISIFFQKTDKIVSRERNSLVNTLPEFWQKTNWKYLTNLLQVSLTKTGHLNLKDDFVKRIYKYALNSKSNTSTVGKIRNSLFNAVKRKLETINTNDDKFVFLNNIIFDEVNSSNKIFIVKKSSYFKNLKTKFDKIKNELKQQQISCKI
ncbi:MAG: hypothetical protein PVI75_01635 [Gammaproteobacteria bacterium]|jgi:hypothetical protein